MRKKPVVLGLLATATGLAVLGTVGAQTSPPGTPGSTMPASANYATPTTYGAAPGSNGYTPSRPTPNVPQNGGATTFVRPYSDWTPAPPPAGYVPPMPQSQSQTTARYPYQAVPTPTLAPAGSGMGAQNNFGHATPKPRLPSPTLAGNEGVRPASGVDLPPPNFDLPSPRMTDGVRTAGGGIPAPNFNPPAPAFNPPTLTPVPTPEPTFESKFPQPPAFPAAPELKPTAPAMPPAIASVPTTPAAPTFTTPTLTPTAPTTAMAPKPLPSVPTTDAKPLPLPTPGAPSTGTANLAAPAMLVPGGSLPARLAPSVIVEAFAPETVNFGQEFKYELLVRNAGGVGVSNVKVEDELPMGARFLSSDPPAEVSGEHLSWAVGTIEAGADRRITVRIKPSDEGEVRSRATVSFSTAVDARTRVTRPRVTVTVTGPESARVGEEASFLIKVTNNGSGPATKLMLKATLTEGLFCPKVPSAGGNEIETTLADVKPGETKTIKLPVAAARSGMQGCQVVAAAEGSPDSSARVAVNVVEALLQLKQTGPAHCLVRSEPTYTIELTNPGTASTDPMAVYAVLPEGFDHIQASDGGTFNATTRAVTWRLPSLPAGGTRQVSLKLRAAIASDGVLRTLAQCGPETAAAGQGVMAASAQMGGGRTLEAKAETPVRAEGVPSIRFEVAGVDGVVEVGKEAVYEIRVTNQGTGPCTNVMLAAALADGTSYTGANGPSQIKAQGQQLVFEPIPTLGVKGELVYRVRVRGTMAGEQRLRVQLTCDQVTNPVVKEENTRFYKE